MDNDQKSVLRMALMLIDRIGTWVVRWHFMTHLSSASPEQIKSALDKFCPLEDIDVLLEDV